MIRGALTCLRVMGAAACLIAVTATHAAAQSCTATIGAVSFGNIDLTTGSNFDTTANVNVVCTGAANTTVRACPNIGAGSGGSSGGGSVRYALNGTDQLGYNLFKDPARNEVWGSVLGGVGTNTPPPVDVALDASGHGSSPITIYGRVFANQQSVPPNFYQSALQIMTASQLAGGGVTCVTIAGSNARTSSFSVTARDPTTCTVSATALNFGSMSTINAEVTSSATITASCSPSTLYTIRLGGGLSGASDPEARQMFRAGNTLTYGLYRDSSHMQPWGETLNVNTESGTGTGGATNFTVFGRIPPQQTPPVGTYSDVVIVTLEY